MTRFDATAPADGKILVARQTDPGWILLYPRVSGLIVERGSLLSHTAIIARELKIPCLVGVRGATDRIRNGQSVELNATSGTVVVTE
jgi:pyruvate,water dikinase